MALFPIPRALAVALTILLYVAVAGTYEARINAKTCHKACVPGKGHGCAGECAVCDPKTRRCVGGGGNTKPPVGSTTTKTTTTRKTSTTRKSTTTPKTTTTTKTSTKPTTKRTTTTTTTTRTTTTTTEATTKPPGPPVCFGMIAIGNPCSREELYEREEPNLSSKYFRFLYQSTRMNLSDQVSGQTLHGDDKWYTFIQRYGKTVRYIPGACLYALHETNDDENNPGRPSWCN